MRPLLLLPLLVLPFLIFLVSVGLLFGPALPLVFDRLATFQSNLGCVISSLDRVDAGGGIGALYSVHISEAGRDNVRLARNVAIALAPTLFATSLLSTVAVLASGFKPGSRPRRCAACILVFMLVLIYASILYMQNLAIMSDLKEMAEYVPCTCVGPPIEDCTDLTAPVVQLAWQVQVANTSAALEEANEQYDNFDEACACMMNVSDTATEVVIGARVGLICFTVFVLIVICYAARMSPGGSRWARAGPAVAPAPAAPTVRTAIPATATLPERQLRASHSKMNSAQGGVFHSSMQLSNSQWLA